MKILHLLTLLFLLPGALCAQSTAQPQTAPATQPPSQGALDWSVLQTWPLPAKPLAFVHSLDNLKVFVLGNDATVYILSAEGRLLGKLPVDPAVTAVDISPRGEMLYAVNGKDNTFTAYSIDFVRNIDITGAPMEGKENAPLTLIVFSDFQCPHCGKVPGLLKELMAKNPDSIRMVFKHLPLAMHPQAEPAALAAIAAQNQGKFWQMHDALFATADLNPQQIEEVATTIGLDMERFRKDWNDPATRQRLVKDLLDAREAEINGTPTLFINGRRVKERSPEALQRMVDEALAREKK